MLLFLQIVSQILSETLQCYRIYRIPIRPFSILAHRNFSEYFAKSADSRM